MASDLETLIKDDTLYAEQLSPIGRRWFTQKMLGVATARGAGNLVADTTAKRLRRLKSALGSSTACSVPTPMFFWTRRRHTTIS